MIEFGKENTNNAPLSYFVESQEEKKRKTKTRQKQSEKCIELQIHYS